MRLAKPHLDLGMFTADIDSHRQFWGDDIGLRLDHELPFDALWVQHRYDAHGSVIKVNHYRHPMPDVPPSGLTGLTIAREGVSPREARTEEVVERRNFLWLKMRDRMRPAMSSRFV